MSKVTMPKPLRLRWNKYTGRYDISEDHRAAGDADLITTTQAEAYADARVREALRSLLRRMNGHVRAAHSRFGETGNPYDEGRRIAYEQAAADIRTLIPPNTRPGQP